jgi:uncharacterized protein YkwD
MLARIVLVLLSLSLLPGVSVADPWIDSEAQRQLFVHRLNQERERAGMPPLRLIPALCQAAQRHAEEVGGTGRLRLSRESTEAMQDRLRREGYTAHEWRESLMASDADIDDVVASWKRQDGSFRQALAERFLDVGIGIASLDGMPLYAVLFGWHEGDYFARETAALRDQNRVAAEMLARVNAVRRNAGLPPVVLNPLLGQVAQRHAEDMLARSYSGHRNPEGRDPSERARAMGYPEGIGENLVEQRFSVEEAMEAWLGSRDHRRNILDPGIREMGVGLAVGAGYDAGPGGYRVVWVQNFGRGMSWSGSTSGF